MSASCAVWNPKRISEAALGHWHGSPDFSGARISTNTRTLEPGDVFLAIKGERFDAHGFAQQAVDRGAQALIVEHRLDIDIPQFVCDSTRLTFGLLAKFHRQSFKQLKVLCLTGSSGKTTTKEMLGSILSNIGPTLITEGNLNNDIGVPTMLLRLTSEYEYAVMELGANHLGEIAFTTSLCQPDVAAVLNIGSAHLGEYGSRANIASAKSEIYTGLQRSNGIAILPDNCDYLSTLKQVSQKHAMSSVSVSDLANMRLLKDNGDTLELELSAQGKSADFTLPLSGAHNCQNAQMAAAMALSMGVSFEQVVTGLSQVARTKGRLNPIDFGEHLLVDDSYNANPEAVLAALKTLQQIAQRKHAQSVLVLGDIGELGDAAEFEHAALGRNLAKNPPDLVLCLGEHMKHLVQSAGELGVHARHFESMETLATAAQEALNLKASVLLLKGSRFMRMERLIDILKERTT